MRSDEMRRALAATLTALIYFSSLLSSCAPYSGGDDESWPPVDDPLGQRRDNLDPAPPTDYILPSVPYWTNPPGQVVGATRFTHSVTPDGQAIISIPLDTPKGRAEIEPNLALTYSSRGSADIAGIGWSLRGLSTISLCGKTPAQDRAWGGGAPTEFCLNGARLVEVATNDFRTEVDSNQKVTRIVSASPPRFEVRTVNGPKYVFNVVEGGASPHTWHLSRVEGSSAESVGA